MTINISFFVWSNIFLFVHHSLFYVYIELHPLLVWQCSKSPACLEKQWMVVFSLDYGRSLSLHCTLFQSNCIPKATTSLKVLSELPIIVVIIYQVCQ